MDPYWEGVAEYLISENLAGAQVVAPLALREIFPVTKSYNDVLAADAATTDALVLHKASYSNLGRRYTRAALARLSPTYANEVFVVLTARGAALDPTDPHVDSMRGVQLWADEPEVGEPEPVVAQAPSDPLLRQVALVRWWDELRATPRARDPRRLTRFGRKAFSQNDEDGIILEIFNRIGSGARRFVEFGVETGIECNTALLLAAGWSGLWLEGSPKSVAAVNKRHSTMIATGRLTIRNEIITAENIDELLSGETELDLLSIDIDFNDYWVWKAIETVRPRVVVIEYNATFPPPVDFVVEYDPKAIWNTTTYYGASLSMLERLGRKKGYALVGCCLAGVNAFFVREDQLTGPDGEARFREPFTAAEHYEPPRYELSGLTAGHKPGFGPNDAAVAIGELSGPD